KAATDARKQREEQSIAANTIGNPTAYRAQETARHHDQRGEVPGADLCQPVLIVEEESEEACEADEAAESEAVEQAEPRSVGLAEDDNIVAPCRSRWTLGAVLGHQRIEDQHQGYRQHR